MLSTVKSANVGFQLVMQLYTLATTPANAPSEKNSYYKCNVTFLWVSTMCAQILGFSRVY